MRFVSRHLFKKAPFGIKSVSLHRLFRYPFHRKHAPTIQMNTNDIDNAIEHIQNLTISDDPNSKISTVVDRSYKAMNAIMDRWCADYDTNFTGGKMRGSRGEQIEQFVREVISTIGEVYDVNVRAVKGDKDKKQLTLPYGDTTLTKSHQVDIHVYREDTFVSAIECKAYLDSCYYVRACDDFRLFDKFDYNIKKYIFALENSIDDKTKAFTDLLTDQTCNNIFYILDGKRVSIKPVFVSKYRKPVNREKLERFVRTMIQDLVS